MYLNLPKFGRRLGVAATLTVALALSAACGSSSSSSPAGAGGASRTSSGSSQKITSIAVDISGITGDEIPILVADEQNLWTKYGISVDLKQLGTAVQYTALATDQVQIGIGGITGLEQATKGAHIKIIGSLGPSFGEFLVQSNVQTPGDLKGKTLGASTAGSTSDNLQRIYLQENGVPTSAYTTDYFQGNLASVVAALSHKQIAGTFVEPPFMYQAIAANPTLHPVGDIESSDVAGLTPNLVFVNTDWAAAHQDAVKEFIAGWRAAIAESKADSASAIKDLAAATKTTSAIATQWYQKQVDLDVFGQESTDAFAIQQKALSTSDPSISAARYASVVDNSYLGGS
jgi:ABC-type nitrate/sulfonate/bicarbonate transport system substrate-binding protein